MQKKYIIANLFNFLILSNIFRNNIIFSNCKQYIYNFTNVFYN